MPRSTWFPMLVLGLSVAGGCGKDGKPAEDGQPAGEAHAPAAAPLFLAPVLADPSLASVPVDSTGVALGDWDMAYAATDREGYWLVDYTWLYLEMTPVELHTFAEMFDLEAAGAIDSSTVVSFAMYRVGLEAKDHAELLERSRSRRPPKPPEPLLRAVEEFLQTSKP